MNYWPVWAKEAAMPDRLQFRVEGQWTAARRGRVEAENVEHSINFSAPPEFRGEAGYWTPEYFFIAAVASCFITTFRAIAEASRFDPVSLDISVEGVVGRGEGGYEFTDVVLRPRLTIREEADRQRAARLLEKTEHSCLVSRSLKSKVTMEPQIELVGTQAAGAGLELVEAQK
jgi:peroxiredoxin-like protein